MSRIRSIHPGQWTDEAFVECSMPARLLSLALRNEADDGGIFEWKPLQIKMRLFPADSVNVSELLSELEKSGQIRKYETADKPYGMIRNFGKYQSPRRPSFLYPRPTNETEWLSFTAISYGQASVPETPNPDTDGNDNSPANTIPDTDGHSPADGDGDGIGGEIITTMTAQEGKPYPFAGKVIRLNKTDYDRLKKRYYAIPDLDAELWNLDDHYVRKGSEDWFHRLPKSLNVKHQEMIVKNPPKPRKQDMASRQAEVMRLDHNHD